MKFNAYTYWLQGMLDFDYLSSRKTPSVAAMIYPFRWLHIGHSYILLSLWSTCSGNHKQKLYWGHEDIMIPVYKDMSEAFKRHPDADVLVNFASLRSAYEATMETMQYPQVCRSTFIHWNCISTFVDIRRSKLLQLLLKGSRRTRLKYLSMRHRRGVWSSLVQQQLVASNLVVLRSAILGEWLIIYWTLNCTGQDGMYVCVCACMCVCIRVCACVCTMYTHTCTYTCVHIRTPVLEIVVGHRTFSDQNCWLSEQFWLWSDKLSRQIIYNFRTTYIFNAIIKLFS